METLKLSLFSLSSEVRSGSYLVRANSVLQVYIWLESEDGKERNKKYQDK